jgi:hypothetical protein
MYRDCPPLLLRESGLLLESCDDFLAGHLEVDLFDELLVLPRCQDRRLVAQIRDVGAGETGGERSQPFRVFVRAD